MLAPKVRGQKGGSGDDWIAVGTKKEAEVQKRLEKKVQLAKEIEEVAKEKEKAAEEKNPFLKDVKVDKTLKYASFDEIVRRTEAAEQEKLVQLETSVFC